MSLRLVEMDKQPKEPGDYWFAPHMKETDEKYPEANWLSIHYRQDWKGKRDPIVVCCPDGSDWCVDSKSWNGDGWKVTGELPNITCSPSIGTPMPGQPQGVYRYHGWLQNGEFIPA